jgi:hypothetical protein
MSRPNPFPLPVINQTLDMKSSIILPRLASSSRRQDYCDYSLIH